MNTLVKLVKPVFLITIWNFTCSPTETNGLIVILFTMKLDSKTFVSFEALLLLILESGVLEFANTLLTIVVLSSVILVTIFKVAEAPFAKSPISHLPVLKSYLPFESSPTYEIPAGRISTAYASTAISGPLFVTLIVHVTVSPMTETFWETNLTTLKSASALDFVVLLAILLVSFGS